MTYAVGIRNTEAYFPLPIGKAGGGRTIAVSTAPVRIQLAAGTEIVYLEATAVRLFVEFGDSTVTAGTTNGTFRYTVGPGTGRYLATDRMTHMAIVTDAGAETVYLEQY